MSPEDQLEGLDPYDLYDAEAARIAEYFSSVPDDDPRWSVASRCEGWSVRDVIAHLAAGEEYQRASLEGGVETLLEHYGGLGVTDLDSFNEITLRQFDRRSPSDLIAMWRRDNAEARRGFRDRGDGMVDTTVGDYPARWQAIHLAIELAIHADDAYVPVNDDEAASRARRLAQATRFVVAESKPDLTIAPVDGGTRLAGEGSEAVLDDATFVDAVAHRIDPEELSGEARDLLGGTHN
ncbi:MAG TPA: maleylpyruvate isomerase family mycothiol-dependent enzyme [Microthrixaceae bacterium]|nr:maleylpyruvate isomerase family mycothiol-dependent enzyme [Microthrixaceae bacterium]